MRNVGFAFWVKVGVSAGLFGLASLLLVSEGWRHAFFGFQPGDAILGPVVAVLIQGGVVAALLAAANWRVVVGRVGRWLARRLAPPAETTGQPAPTTAFRRGAFEVAAQGAMD